MHSPFPLFGEALALLCAVIWGLAVVFFRKSGEQIHPLALNVFKNILASLMFLPTMLIFGEPILRPVPVGSYLLLLASGVLGLGLGDTLFFTSLNFLGAGLSAIVGCLYSPFIIILAVAWLGETLTIWQIFGAGLIVSAVLIATLRVSRGEITRRSLLLGIGCGILGTISTTVGVVMIKPLLEQSPLLWATEVRLVGGVVALCIILGAHPARRRILASLASTTDRFHPLVGSILGAYLAMVVWLGGMKYAQASIAAVLNQTSTVFVFIFAALILRERVTLRRAVGILMAFAGVALASFG